MAAKIAGKYLSELDPSREMVSAKIESKLSGVKPSRSMLEANPRIAFGAGGLGFNSSENGFYS
jgi:hypothetical protein